MQNDSIVVRKGFIDHLWLPPSGLEIPDPAPTNGSVVTLISSQGAYLGKGLYNGRSRKTVRVLWEIGIDESVEAFLKRKIEAAFALRQELQPFLGEECSRLVFSEGDLLSGLIIDRYKNYYMVEYGAKGMFYYRSCIHEAIKSIDPNSIIYPFARKKIQKKESFNVFESPRPEPFWVSEHGIQYLIDVTVEHKTGFYLDQASSRRELAQLTMNKNILDLCCFTGGFSLSAKRGGAKKVVGVDNDVTALELAKKNAERNQLVCDFREADAFKVEAYASFAHQFDVVVLDPPKLATDFSQKESALKKYFFLNKNAMDCLQEDEDGWLVTCSCTGNIQESEFVDMLREASRASHRTLQVVRTTYATPDHPYQVLAPESQYLKVFWIKVGKKTRVN